MKDAVDRSRRNNIEALIRNMGERADFEPTVEYLESSHDAVGLPEAGYLVKASRNEVQGARFVQRDIDASVFYQALEKVLRVRGISAHGVRLTQQGLWVSSGTFDALIDKGLYSYTELPLDSGERGISYPVNSDLCGIDAQEVLEKAKAALTYLGRSPSDVYIKSLKEGVSEREVVVCKNQDIYEAIAAHIDQRKFLASFAHWLDFYDNQSKETGTSRQH